ncbi:MAG: hypothetical protein LBL83_04445 [Clostridiales bacterium]|jgi:hypothetical protein|nr:hypothetical protein [Clostridiales bacterium]
MMMTKNKIEDEVDEIRFKIYEEIKNMTASELSDYYRESGEAAAKKYGFKRVAGVKE